MRTSLYIALIFIFCFTSTFSQNSKAIDSLNTAIANSPDDTNKVNLLIQLSSQYDYISSKERVMYLNEAYLLAHKINFKAKEEYTLYFLAKNYFYREMYDLSFAYAIKYIDFLEKEKLTEKILSAQNLLGNIYQKQGKFNEAKQFFFKAASYYKSIEDYQKLGIIFTNISILFLDSNNLDSALQYALSAYKIQVQYNNDSSSIANNLNLIATIELARKNYTSALEISNKALSIYTKIGNELGISLSNKNIGDIHFEMQKYNQALVNYNLCLDYLKDQHWLTNSRDCYLAISKVYAKKGNYKDAFNNLELSNLFRDSIANLETTATFLEMEVKYELSKNEKYLAEKEKEIIEKEFELTKKNTQRNILMISLFAITLLLSLSIYAFIQKKKDNNLIKIQKEVVELKHKEITDSINYAERIQRSFLASKEMLDRNLSSPWGGAADGGCFSTTVTASEEHSVIASEEHPVTASEEHSIIASEERTKQSHATEEIASLPTVARNDDNEEVARIDGNAVTSSVRPSANVSRSDSNYELLEYKPDKMPVGKHENENEPFTLHTIQIQKGDIIYALTDGFADQFGGEKSKKYMIKNLKEFLIKIAHLPMPTQEQKLAKEFATWKGSNEQVDDVCVIGVKI